ncbi:hypothetical protein NMG60_11013448 [Bertholletia excelsa]
MSYEESSSEKSSEEFTELEGEVAEILLSLHDTCVTGQETADASNQKPSEEIAEQSEHKKEEKSADEWEDATDEETSEESEDAIEEGTLDGHLPVNEEFIEGIRNRSIESCLVKLGKPIDGLNPPTLPPFRKLRRLIKNCSEPFEKQLTRSDCRQRRFCLPSKLVQNHFIGPLMKKKEQKDLEKKEGVNMTVYGKDGNEYPIVFKPLTDEFYALYRGWGRFIEEHELQPWQHFLTIWMFRHKRSKGLCFAIVGRKFPIFSEVETY